ncbi:nucleoside hydrolase [Cellulomonas iranensis]|uniref:nucleoside hydrolase n=1 Tax=Cellulomonas iranensis TaxID=76862 RepID=UPI000B3D4DC5|nr:nucleoside hydrolase [Cellulomonas iranensis]
MPIPVILDCDPGHDDVFAIWLAAGNPALDLRAITTVSGNGYLEHTTRNALVACTVAGIEGVPVAAGADRPLARTLTPASWIHGENALGGPELPEPTVALDPRPAVQLVLDTLEASDEPVTIIPTGPLTNVATLLRDHPEARDRIREIVWMGGSTTRGNATPYAEFNAWADPEAVDVVLASGVPFTMVGLNITHQALISAQVRERIATIGNATSAFGVELLDYFCSTYLEAEKMPEGPLHDPVAVALVADPAVATTVRTRVDVELRGERTAGATCVDLIDILRLEHNATVALDLDVERFWGLVESALRALR